MVSLREQAGLSQSQLAKIAGVGQSTIARLEAGETRSPRSLLALARALDCSPEYLAGETEQQSSSENRDRWKDGDAALQSEDDPDIVEVAEIDLKYGLGATFSSGHVTSEMRRFSRRWLRNFTQAPPQLLFWALGDGDSMEPTIRSGEVILIDASQRTPRMSEGIWAVGLGEFLMVKRLHYAGSDQLELRSDNQLIPPIKVAEGELHIVGRVVAVVRRL